MPRHPSEWLRAAAHEALHTLDLSDGNRTTDVENHRVVHLGRQHGHHQGGGLRADHILRGEPKKLLVISTCDLTNAALEALFVPNLSAIVQAPVADNHLELTCTTLIIHG